MSALKDFMDLMPAKLSAEVPAQNLRDPGYWQDVWQSAQAESHRVLELVDKVAAVVVQPNETFELFLPAPQLVKEAIKRAGSGCEIQLDPGDDMPDLRVNRALASRMLDILLAKAAELNGGKGTLGKGTLKVKIDGPQSVWGTPGVRLSITGDGTGWTENGNEALFSPLAPGAKDGGLELLSAYFIANHHGGDVAFVSEGKPRFVVTLPNDPLAAERPPVKLDFLDDVFEMFELQQLT
jgi:nitrogen-specific signal transduction histidine kinase